MKRINIEKLAGLIREHASKELQDNRICGKEIVVHQNGECVFHETFGYSAVGGPPLQKKMLYRAASMTKPLTAATVAHAADRGLLDLNEPASDFYPQMKNMRVATVKNGKIVSLHPAKNVIRVRDLLSHTSGIGCSPLLELTNEDTSHFSLREAVSWILDQPLSFEPLTAQSYSPTAAFDVAAGIVEIASGIAFDEYLKRNLFEPLRMTDTTFDPTEDQQRRMVKMHDRTAEGFSVTAEMREGCVFESFIPARMAAGAGIMTTAGDYIRFADMLCMGGISADGARVLSDYMVQQMATPNVPDSIDMGCERWGLGMRIVTGPGYPHGLGVGCFGWSGAYGTHFWVDPDNKISVVMMKNSRFDGGAGNHTACELERDVSDSLS